jgi:uncharacterized membrane protein YdbT with pleckstrin-like domain
MALSSKLLGADEQVILHLRTHGKVLVLPALALVLVAAAAGAGAALIPRDYRPIGQLALAGVGMVLTIWWSVIPYLRWRTSTYTITNRRLITRRGILNKTGKDLPLLRINDVSYERSLLDRMLGCGSLFIQTAAEGGTIVLDDVPDVERVHVTMTELLFDNVSPVTRGYPRPEDASRG